MQAAYLGPKGTFTHQAAAYFFPNAELVPKTHIEDVFISVASAECSAGAAPLENSTEGAVNATLDALIEHNVNITGLVNMPINHVLMGSGKPDKILGHPQALAQCRLFIKKNFQYAQFIPCASNAEAAKIVSESDEAAAAIGPSGAAAEYGLTIRQSGIQDVASNSTAFIRIEPAGDEDVLPNCRTSVVFSTKNKPGALYRMLSILDSHNVNMTKILSRPIPVNHGEYMFFIDIEGYNVKEADEALKKIKNASVKYKFLGSYRADTIRRDDI